MKVWTKIIKNEKPRKFKWCFYLKIYTLFIPIYFRENSGQLVIPKEENINDKEE